MNKFYNKFHNTYAHSKYTMKDFEDATYAKYNGETNGNDKIYRAKRSLDKKLCGSPDCHCWVSVEEA